MSVNTGAIPGKDPGPWQLSDETTFALQTTLLLLGIKNLGDILSAGVIGIFAVGLDVALFFLVRRRYPRVPRLIWLRAVTMTVFWFLFALISVDKASPIWSGIFEGWFAVSLVLLSVRQPGEVRTTLGKWVGRVALAVYLVALVLALIISLA